MNKEIIKVLKTKDWFYNKTRINKIDVILKETEKAYKVACLPYGLKGLLKIEWIPKSVCEWIEIKSGNGYGDTETFIGTFQEAKEFQKLQISKYC